MRRLEHDFAGWAERTPEQSAVEGPDGRLSYGELERLANCFARAFTAAGVRAGDRVGIHLPRSGRGIAAMLGALRCGAAFVPLDPASPPARVGLIVRDCDLRQVVIAPQLLANWLAAGVHEPVTDFFLSADGPAPEPAPGVRFHSWAELNAHTGSVFAPLFCSRAEARASFCSRAETRASFCSRAEARASTDADRSCSTELAYILYTSGSTGVPKGVMLSHENALAFVDWAADQIALGPEDRVASVAPFHFDLSVFDIWSSLSRGATIVIIDEATVIHGRRMLDRIHEQNIRVIYSVPSAWALMYDAGGLKERGAPSLRVVYFAGEVFPIKQLRRTMEALPEARFFNLFGPTETNVCLAYEVPGLPPAEATAIPIGRASCGDEISIVDEQGRQVAEGETGELLVDGPTVMLGYWAGGERTPAKHPYPTGDLVSRLPSGDLLYHGRRDHMVKVHGHRIELGEVEAALLAHPVIEQAIAFVDEQRLVAVLSSSDAALSVIDVKQHCARLLPRYMIPGDIRIVAELPRTSNGKVDRVRTKRAVLERDVSVLPPLREVTRSP